MNLPFGAASNTVQSGFSFGATSSAVQSSISETDFKNTKENVTDVKSNELQSSNVTFKTFDFKTSDAADSNTILGTNGALTFGAASSTVQSSISETDFKNTKGTTNGKENVTDVKSNELKSSDSTFKPTFSFKTSDAADSKTILGTNGPFSFGTASSTVQSSILEADLKNTKSTTYVKTKSAVPNALSTGTTVAGTDITFSAFGGGVSQLLEGLETLLLSGKYSDVTLKLQERNYNAHRSILAIRSPVFSAMLEHDTKEKATGVIDIVDCDPNIFSDFLHFLYTGSTRKINIDNVINIYTIADKYQVAELCKFCVSYMMSRITLLNFCDILVLSLQYHERELLDSVSQYFVDHSVEIALSASWGSFVASNPVAANELFLKALKFYKQDFDFCFKRPIAASRFQNFSSSSPVFK